MYSNNKQHTKSRERTIKKISVCCCLLFQQRKQFLWQGGNVGLGWNESHHLFKTAVFAFFFVLNNIFYMKFNLIMQCRFRNILNGWFFFGEKLFRLWFTTINFISPLKIYRFFVLCAGSFRLLGSCCNLTMWTERYMTEGKQNLISARHILHFVKKTSNVKAPWII